MSNYKFKAGDSIRVVTESYGDKAPFNTIGTVVYVQKNAPFPYYVKLDGYESSLWEESFDGVNTGGTFLFGQDEVEAVW